MSLNTDGLCEPESPPLNGATFACLQTERRARSPSRCSEAFTPSYHVLPSALFGAQPSTHRHQLAPDVPLNPFLAPVCGPLFTTSDLNEFFFFSSSCPSSHFRTGGDEPPAALEGLRLGYANFLSSSQACIFLFEFFHRTLPAIHHV